MTLKEATDLRLKNIADARKILDKASSEKRSMTAEETAQYDKLLDEGDRLLKEARELHAQESRAARLEEAERESLSLIPRQTRDPELRSVGELDSPEGPGEHGEIRYRLRGGVMPDRRFRLHGKTASPEYRKAFNLAMRSGDPRSLGELRALQADSAPDGGFLIMPQQIVAGILRAVDDYTWARQISTVIPIPMAASLGAPTQETNPADADWTGEITSASADSTQKFGKRELKPSHLAKAIDASRKLLRMVPSIEQFLIDRLSYKFAITMEKGYLTGNGANQPLGVFTSSAEGVTTARNTTCGTTTAITDTGLIDLFYSLKAPYRNDPTCVWVMSRTAVGQVRKLKDNVGNYLWKPGLSADQEDTLLGKPVRESEYAPATFTTGQPVVIVGAFRYYWIADSLQMEVQRLDELLARTNQVEFIGRAESDGMPTIAEAFARGVLG